MAVNLFEALTDDNTLNTKYLKFIVSQQSRTMNVSLGEDIIHIISIYSITYNWHGRFKWFPIQTDFPFKAYSSFPIQTDSIIAIKSIDFEEIYIVHCSTPNSHCYNYYPYKDKFYEFMSRKPTYSRNSHSTLMSDGRLISMGGSTKHIDIYDPRSGIWINHNYYQNITDFGDKCVIVQDQLNSNIIHCVGGKNIKYNALHSMDTRQGFRCVSTNNICINAANPLIPLQKLLIPLQKLTGHAVVMSDMNRMLLFGGRALNGVYKINLTQNAMDEDDNRKTAEWVGLLDRSLFGYDITPDRKYLIVAGGYDNATFSRRSTINILDLCHVDGGKYPLNLMPNLQLKLPTTLTSIGIATLDDTIHIFGGFDGRTRTNTHWVARTRDIVMGSEY